MDLTTNILNRWANQARDNYINDGMTPNESVKDIIEDNDLNYKQAQRLCEATNLSIKSALREAKGPDHVQFPLAAINEVMDRNINNEVGEVEKDASLRQESFLDKYAEYFYTERRSKKEEELVLTCDKIAMLIESLDKRTGEARRAVNLGKHEFNKVAESILGYIKDEARATGSVNESYATLSRVMPKHAGLIDRLYKFAQQVLEIDLIGRHIEETELAKNANWIPNPNSEIVKLFEKYAELHQNVQQARTRYAKNFKAKQEAESQLRQMILSEE